MWLLPETFRETIVWSCAMSVAAILVGPCVSSGRAPCPPSLYAHVRIRKGRIHGERNRNFTVPLNPGARFWLCPRVTKKRDFGPTGRIVIRFRRAVSIAYNWQSHQYRACHVPGSEICFY